MPAVVTPAGCTDIAVEKYGIPLHQRYRRIVGRTLGNRGPTAYDFDFSVPVEEVVVA